MKTSTLQRLALALALLSLVAFSSAAAASDCCGKYDLENEVTFDGVVEEMKFVDGPMGNVVGRLIVRGEKFLYEVHLGPQSYMVDEKISFGKGDEVTVTASPFDDRKPQELEDGRIAVHVLARKVALDDLEVLFRNEQGKPLWSPMSGR